MSVSTVPMFLLFKVPYFKIGVSAFLVWLVGFIINVGNAQVEVVKSAAAWHEPMYASAVGAAEEKVQDVQEQVPDLLPWLISLGLGVAAAFLGYCCKRLIGLARGEHLPIRDDIQRVVDSLRDGAGWVYKTEGDDANTMTANLLRIYLANLTCAGNVMGMLSEDKKKFTDIAMNWKERDAVAAAALSLRDRLNAERERELVAKAREQLRQPCSEPKATLGSAYVLSAEDVSALREIVAKHKSGKDGVLTKR